MRFVILNTDYIGFLRWLYEKHPGLEKQSYEQQLKVRSESLFGVADFYSSNLCKLGHEAHDIHANNRMMQKAWAKEHRVRPGFKKWMYRILLAQIKHYRPDVLINHDIGLSSQFFKEVKPHIRLLVGQYAAPLPQREDYDVYDLMLSSLPNYVDYFRKLGIKSLLFRQMKTNHHS